MKPTKKHFVGAGLLTALAAIAMIGGASGIGGGDSSSTPKKAERKTTKPTKDTAAAELHKLMKQAAKKDPGQPTTSTSTDKKMSAKRSGCSPAVNYYQTCINDFYDKIQLIALRHKDPQPGRFSVAYQIEGQPVSYPKICTSPKGSCRFEFKRMQRGRYRSIAAYSNSLSGSAWSYPLVSAWIDLR